MHVDMHKMAYQKEIVAVCLDPLLADLNSHTALIHKRHIFASRAVIWCAEHLYTLYSFCVMLEGKRIKKERKKKEQNRKFHF